MLFLWPVGPSLLMGVGLFPVIRLPAMQLHLDWLIVMGSSSTRTHLHWDFSSARTHLNGCYVFEMYCFLYFNCIFCEYFFEMLFLYFELCIFNIANYQFLRNY